MAEPATFSYRAFISYSHDDLRWAKWLHRTLENFRVDSDLVGRKTALGSIPKSLRPIFRDRDDFAAGHSLSEQTLAALDASAALIVLCSPTAAESAYVNEEIRLFRSRHSGRPVIPLIVGGTPGDAELECFPAALRVKLDADGNTTSEAIDVLAADLRETGDGKNLALAKVIAGLLGVSSDDVFRRADRDRQRKARRRIGLVAALCALAIVASGSAVYAWQQLKTNQAFLDTTLYRATQLVDMAVAQANKYGVPRKATLEFLTRAEGLFTDMARLGALTPELRHRRALMLLEFAENYAILGDTTRQRARAEEAQRIMAELAAENQNSLEHLQTLAWAHGEKGDVLMVQGNLAEALDAYRNGLAIVERMIAAEPDNTNSQRDLSVFCEKIGVVLGAQGNFEEAMHFFRDGLEIADRLAKSNPRYPLWQSDLARSHARVGGVLEAGGRIGEALEAYRRALAITIELANADPSNAAVRRELYFAYAAVGRALMKLGNHAEALVSYEKSLTIAERAAAADPSHARWQHSLGSAHAMIGDIQRARGDVAGALHSYELSREIVAQLNQRDPNNAGWQSDLAQSHYTIGDLLSSQGNLAEALKSYREGQAVVERLARLTPVRSDLQRQLAIGHGKVALLLAQQGDATQALSELRKGRAIIMQLSQQSPDNALLPEDAARFDAEIGRLEQTGN
jgi:tetratricopeptide (TPR) repeat protein